MEEVFQDKNILITGASGGLGSVLCERLLQEGFRSLGFAYFSSDQKLQKILAKYDLDPDKHCFQADLSKEDEVKGFGSRYKNNFGTPWALINLAGLTTNGMSWKLSLNDFDKVIKANLYSTFLTCREFIPAMREQGGGRILNASSVVAKTGAVGAAHYCAAKASIEGLTRALALELASKNITVNALAIGYFKYGMIETVPQAMKENILMRIPVGRLGEVDDLFSFVLFLLSPESAYLTGQSFNLSGGLQF